MQALETIESNVESLKANLEEEQLLKEEAEFNKTVTSNTNTSTATDTSTVTVYRVQGGDPVSSKVRLTPDTNTGKFNISGNDTLFLNFGDWGHALDWLNTRGMTSELVSFDVQADFLDVLRGVSVNEWQRDEFPDFAARPLRVDTDYPDQYGIRNNLFSELKEYTIPGTFGVVLTWAEYAALASVGITP